MERGQEKNSDDLTEVSRAWVEIQKYGDMVSSTNRLPWHAKEKRPLKIEEIITLLAAHAFKHHEVEPEEQEEEAEPVEESAEGEEGGSKRKLRPMSLKEAIAGYDSMLDVNAAKPKRRRGC